MNAISPDTLLLVGTVGRPHGVAGEVKVVPETDDPDRLRGLGRVFVGATPEGARKRMVESLRLQPTKRGVTALMKFEGVAGRDGAELLRGQSVFAAEDDLPPLEEGEVYLHDLIGLTVITEDGETIGTVTDVMLGAQDLLVVKREGKSDALVPDVDEIVTLVDLDAEQITIAPPDGLLD